MAKVIFRKNLMAVYIVIKGNKKANKCLTQDYR